MNKKKFLESGHFPTLIAAFLYFDVSFMVWVLLGPLAPFLSEMLKLTPYQKGLLTAIPLIGDRRREFRRSSADCGTLVSARVSGAGHGHRWRGEFGNSHRDSVRAPPRSEVWMGEHFRFGHASSNCCVDLLRSAGERQ